MDQVNSITRPTAMSGMSGQDVLRWSVGAIVFAALLYLAGFKPIGLSADLYNYEILYNRTALTSLKDIVLSPDAAFFLLAKACAWLGFSFSTFAFIVALLTLAFFAASLTGLGAKPSTLLLLYLSYLFWLHPYTQIRTGLGSALLVFGFYGNRRFGWIAAIVGVLVHNSLVIALVAYLGLRLRPIIVLAMLGMAAVAALLGILQGLLAALSNRALAYQDLALSGVFTEINIFSLMPLSMIFFLLTSLISIREMSKQQIIEGILSIVGIVSFYALIQTPVLAFRVWEIFMIFFVIFAARLVDRSIIFKLAIVPYILLGVRSSFFSATSLVGG